VIRAVLFDAGATLVHPDPPVEAVYAREFAADGARFSDGDLYRALSRASRNGETVATTTYTPFRARRSARVAMRAT